MASLDESGRVPQYRYPQSAVDFPALTLRFGQSGLEELLRRIASGSGALRLLTADRGLDHFSALALIKSRVAGIPLSQPWQLI